MQRSIFGRTLIDVIYCDAKSMMLVYIQNSLLRGCVYKAYHTTILRNIHINNNYNNGKYYLSSNRNAVSTVMQNTYRTIFGFTKGNNDTPDDTKEKHNHHFFDDYSHFNPYNMDVVSLSAGCPGPSLLKKCVPMFQGATNHRMELEKDNAYLFQYGPISGMWDYREQLSKFLTKRYGDKVNRQDLMLTSGANQGLAFIMNTLLPQDGIIFVEDTTYMGALDIFKMFPLMKIVPVPMNKDGVDTVAFEKIVAHEKTKGTWNLTEDKMFWAMFYTIPTFHNPTGVTSSEKCCNELVRIAREMNLLVVSDDTYNLVYYGDSKNPPRRLFSYDRFSEGFRGGHVISLGTFSKILAPGARVGWLEAGSCSSKILKNSRILANTGAVNQYMSGIMASMLELGLMDTHLDYVVGTLKSRMSALCDTLDQYLPENCSYRKPDGGYFLWIQLPETVDATKLNEWCIEKYKVDAVPGSIFSSSGEFKNYLRLAVGFHDEDILTHAARNLCHGINDYVVNELGVSHRMVLNY